MIRRVSWPVMDDQDSHSRVRSSFRTALSNPARIVAVIDETVLGRPPVKYAVGSYSMNTTLTNMRRNGNDGSVNSRDRFGQRGPGVGVEGSGRDEALIERHGSPRKLLFGQCRLLERVIAFHDVRRPANDTTRRARWSSALPVASSNSAMLSCVVSRLTPYGLPSMYLHGSV